LSRAESLLISGLITSGTTKGAVKEGVEPNDFSTYKEEYEWLLKQKKVPSREVFLTKFPDFRFRKVDVEDIPVLITGIKENSVRKQLALLIERSAKKLKDVKPELIVEEMRAETHRILEKTAAGGVTEIFSEGKQFALSFKEKQKLRLDGKAFGIPTGFPTIDLKTGGLLPGYMYLVIARQGQSKTYWMLYLAAMAALAGKRVLWISREMPEDMVTYRIHTIISSHLRGPDNGFSNLGLILGREDITYEDYRDFINKLRREVPGRFFIPNDKKLRVRQIEQYVERYQPDIVFYDYIGIISGGDSGRTWQALGEEANVAKEIALAHNIPILLASQVNRSAKDSDEAPMVENISFSDSLGYAADLIFSLQLSNLEPELGAESKKFLELWVRKSRYGAHDFSIISKFDPDKGVFQEIESPAELLDRMGKKKKKRRRSRTIEVEDKKLSAMLNIAEAIDPEQKRKRNKDGSPQWIPTKRIKVKQ